MFVVLSPPKGGRKAKPAGCLHILLTSESGEEKAERIFKPKFAFGLPLPPFPQQQNNLFAKRAVTRGYGKAGPARLAKVAVILLSKMQAPSQGFGFSSPVGFVCCRLLFHSFAVEFRRKKIAPTTSCGAIFLSVPKLRSNLSTLWATRPSAI